MSGNRFLSGDLRGVLGVSLIPYFSLTFSSFLATDDDDEKLLVSGGGGIDAAVVA
jgi:hypothetical protein